MRILARPRLHVGKLFAFLLVVLGGSVGARAQDFDFPGGGQNLPKLFLDGARFDADSARPGQEVPLVVSLSPAAGWHVYGAKEEFGEPPRFRLPKDGGAKLVGEPSLPEGHEHESFGVTSHWIVDPFELRQSVQLPADLAPGPYTLTGVVHYTVCNEQSCLEPTDLAFEATVEIVAADDALADVEFEEGHCIAVVSEKLDPSDLKPGDTFDLVLEFAVARGLHLTAAAEFRPKVVLDAESAQIAEVVGDAKLPAGDTLSGILTLRQTFRVGADVANNTHGVSGRVEFVPVDAGGAAKAPESVEFSRTLIVEGPAVGAGGTKEETGRSGGGGEDPGTLGLWGFLIAAVGSGILALVMPCTYPMIPITISFFTKQAEKTGGSRIGLSLSYGLGIVLIFVVIGVGIGEPITRFATGAWLNLFIGVVFLIFGLSLLGLFTLQPPQFLLQAAGSASRTGGYLGVFLMGLTLVVTSFTCSAPFVGTLLGLGAAQGQTGRVVLGMAVFGATMAAPFVILSLVPGRLSMMPKAGGWMSTFKVFLGWVELAAAIKFLSNAEYAWKLLILPSPLFLAIWAVLLSIGGVYLLSLFSKERSAGPVQRTMAALVLLFAAYCAWGAFGGPVQGDVMHALVPPYSEFGVDEVVGDHEIVVNDFDLALETAKAEGKLLLINFTGYT